MYPMIRADTTVGVVCEEEESVVAGTVVVVVNPISTSLRSGCIITGLWGSVRQTQLLCSSAAHGFVVYDETTFIAALPSMCRDEEVIGGGLLRLAHVA